MYDAGIKTNPQNTLPYFNKGVLFGKLGKYEEAINMFNEVIKIDPRDTEANNYKALMLEKLRNR
ncbi:MAG: tetratricopeptide repeat protein [Thermodesulfobacteriota bacterium]|nr:tetratricopeptide repeat protein [Thermodesulfobacteriota bacterium]